MLRSARNGRSDHSSVVMWCSTTATTWSSAPTRNTSARKGNSRVRSKVRRCADSTSPGKSLSAQSTTLNDSCASSRIHWNGTPSCSPIRVRSDSCRAATSCNAVCNAGTSSAPRSRNTNGKLYAAPALSSCSTSHSRRCAADNGTYSGRSPYAVRAGRVGLPLSARPASSAGVGASNRSRMASSAPSSVRARLTSRVASSECPPRSKKLSSAPTSGSPSTSANRRHSTSSCGVRGPRPPPSATAGSASGRARTSSLPLEFIGRPSTVTNAAGTMYSGSSRPRSSRSRRTSALASRAAVGSLAYGAVPPPARYRPLVSRGVPVRNTAS